MLNGRRARAFATLIAAITWIGLAMQMYLLVNTFIADGSGVLAGVWRFFAFFTLLTNILVAVVTTLFALGRAVSQQALTATGTYIALVGLTYHFILSGAWNPQGLSFVADKINHYATPVLYTLFWIACVPKRAHKWSDVGPWLAYPTFYLFYAMARGALDGFYAYFFIDLPKLGIAGVAVNSAGMFVCYVAIALIFVAIDKWLGPPRRVPA